MDKVLAKPSGITLQEHVSHVVSEAKQLLETFPFVIKKYAHLTGGKDFAKWLIASANYHDDGKRYQKWQSACQKDHQTFLDWQKRNGGGTFRQFELQEPELAGKNLRVAGLRHEIASIELHKNHGFALPVLVAIAAHHGKLSVRHEHRWFNDLASGKDLWKLFYRAKSEGINDMVAEFHNFHVFLEKYPEFSGLRAWLVTADQRASASEAGEEPPKIKLFSYKFPHLQKRNVQQIVEENWQDDFLLIRAPTGAGKTDASLLWAQKQIESGRASRMVIAMPTRFTSNALSINVAESLSETGLYHSSAWYVKFQMDVNEEKIRKNAAKAEHNMARRLFTPVTVCTIDHLLMALTLTREDHHQILFNLMNSCLVIDEADFYDEFTQANILVLLEALYRWKVPVMLMSASLPESSMALYASSGYQINQIREDKSDLDRPRCHVRSVAPAESLEEIEEILEIVLHNRRGIIYANTVARAMEYYNWFAQREVYPILYHSRFIESHKKGKEQELLDALGKKGKGEGIAILTQIGEMSVNISTDLMISDICPIDRLVQRVGRLCRFEGECNQVGELHVVIPQKGGQLYPAPYGSFEKRNWKPLPNLLETIELIEQGKSYSAGDFVQLINRVYPESKISEIKAKLNAQNLKSYFVQNWMISSKENIRDDQESANFWKSRNIDENVDVFVKAPSRSIYNNWEDFQNEKINLTIGISIYLLKQGLEKTGSITTMKISIDDARIDIFYVRNPMAYTYRLGLDLGAEFDQFL